MSLTLMLLIFNILIIWNAVENTPIIPKIIDNSGYDNIDKIKYVYVDQNNNLIIQSEKYNYAEEFLNGVAKIGYRYSYRQLQHGGSEISTIEYGYINKNGNIIIPTRYHDLSYFNEEGYAYGIISFFSVPISFNTIQNFSEDDIKTYLIRFYKLDMDGNEKEISYEDFLNEKDNIVLEKGEFDEDIRLVEQVNNKYVVSKIVSIIKIVFNILVLFGIPVILPIIVLIKVLKKNKKEDVVEK